jgi:hypothetical protein
VVDLSDVAVGLGAAKQQHKPAGQPLHARTRIIATFHSDEGFDGRVDSDPANDAKSDQPFRIMGFTWSKRFGSSPGTWSLTVKGRVPGGKDADRRTDVMRLWEDPEDVWVRIVVEKTTSLDEGKGKPVEVMFGLIDSITESVMRTGDGSREETYTINGSDFMKVLTMTSTYINIHEGDGTLPMVPLYDAAISKIVGRPDEIVEQIVHSWLGNEGIADKQWKMPASLGGRYFFDFLELIFDKLRGTVYDPTLYQPDQWMGKPLWGSLESYSNSILNELFTRLDTQVPYDGVGGGHPQPQLVLRERPFPSGDLGTFAYRALPTHKVSPTDVTARNMTKGAPESRFNYWLLDASGLVGNGFGVLSEIQKSAGREKGFPGSIPVYNTEDMRKHGFRQWKESTRYFPFREDKQWFLHSARWLQLLHDWYSIAPFEQSGSLTLGHLHPLIQIGERIEELRSNGDKIVYYVEGVSHSWSYPGAGSTTLNLTRGEFEDEDLIAIVYDRAEQSTDSLKAKFDLLDEAAGVAGDIPRGSPPTLDKGVGQTDTVERAWLRRRRGEESNVAVEQGEITERNKNRRARISHGSLPDRLVPEEAEVAVGNAEPRPRKPGGNLTQEELERGDPLPVSDQPKQKPLSELGRDDYIERTRNKSGTKRRPKRK